jgi:tRNA (guanine9-N1)-methyltransferase
MKKMKRQEEWLKKKDDIKKHKKDQKRIKKEKIKLNKELLKEVNPEEYRKTYNDQRVINPPREQLKKEYVENLEKGILIIIDCKFEEYMSENDFKSLMKQITLCYSTNKKSKKPFNLILFDVGAMLKKLLLLHNCNNWTGFKYIEEGKFSDLKNYLIEVSRNKKINNTLDLNENNILKEVETNTIYLTGYSENTISTLEDDKIYIIGGLIDRNKLKNITLDKSKELGISNAKLPLGDCIKLKTSKILAINHVFEILSSYHSKTNNWIESFNEIIPERKKEK